MTDKQEKIRDQLDEPIEQYPTWDPEPEESLIGNLQGVRTNVGMYNKNLYIFEVTIDDEISVKEPGKESETEKRSSEGESIAVWGTSVLDDRLETAEEGEEIGIKFFGWNTTGKKEQGSGDKYKLYRVAGVKQKKSDADKEAEAQTDAEDQKSLDE